MGVFNLLTEDLKIKYRTTMLNGGFERIRTVVSCALRM